MGVDLDPALTAGNTINFGGIFNAYYSATTNKVPVVQLYYTAPIQSDPVVLNPLLSLRSVRAFVRFPSPLSSSLSLLSFLLTEKSGGRTSY